MGRKRTLGLGGKRTLQAQQLNAGFVALVSRTRSERGLPELRPLAAAEWQLVVNGRT
jgi:hypothetical protein